MTKDELEKIYSMIENQWFYRIYSDHLVKAYFCYIMSKSNYILKYGKDDLSGILLAKINKHINIFHKIKWNTKFIYEYLRSIKQSSKETRKEAFREFKVDKYLNKLYDKKYDCRVTLLIVDEKQRGNGIGSNLLKQLETECKGKDIAVFTDSFSNMYFYLRRAYFKQNSYNEKDFSIEFSKLIKHID